MIRSVFLRINNGPQIRCSGNIRAENGEICFPPSVLISPARREENEEREMWSCNVMHRADEHSFTPNTSTYNQTLINRLIMVIQSDCSYLG